MNQNAKYLTYIYERYLTLKNSNKSSYDNNDLWKIFEYYTCIKLSQDYKRQFYEYDDIEPTFKEQNKMSRNDTGIDLCDLDKTIVQCKLRKDTLSWSDCATFFASDNIYDDDTKKKIIRWDNLIIARNTDCLLSKNLLERSKLFIDKQYEKEEIIKFCENLLLHPPQYQIPETVFCLRDYQKECIELITNNKKNIIISIPTGTGKNSVIIYSLQDDKKYLILVPRIILMEQLKEEIIKHKPKYKSKIQLISSANNNTFDKSKNITICVFNSVKQIEPYDIFEKIFIDEAHHINKPEIYQIEDETQAPDEIRETIEDDKKYIQTIETLTKYNNNVYLSATIDKISNFEYYHKDIREMINLKYLCDYTVHIPIFSDDPNNTDICKHLIKNYKNIIIYCSTQKDGKAFNQLLNQLQNNCSNYIDSNTPKKERNDIIDKYKKGLFPFLVNVKILVEGFDAPITKGVCFINMPKNGTTLIQIIGRALRLHEAKTIANIILPYSTKDNETNIRCFLRTIAKNDSRIRKSYESKITDGYISIDKTITNNENVELRYELIYNSMGIIINNKDTWMNNFEKVKKYIEENKKRPSSESKETNIKTLGIWLSCQIQNFKNKRYNLTNENIYNMFDVFLKEHNQIIFLSGTDKWLSHLAQCKEFIIKEKKRPNEDSKNLHEKKIGKWFSDQKLRYKKHEQMLKHPEIRKIFENFMEDPQFEFCFETKSEIWNKTLSTLIKYFDTNDEVPSYKNDAILYKWLSHQKDDYNNGSLARTNEYYTKWENLINHEKYRKFFVKGYRRKS
jgi:DNA repair protein RadD